VLSGGRRCCDFDDLARTTLKDQEIAETDVVGGDGDGVGGGGSFDRGTARSFGASTYANVNFFLLKARTFMAMASTDDAFGAMLDVFGSTVETMAEGVVMTCGR
jgi:hypothetical protein